MSSRSRLLVGAAVLAVLAAVVAVVATARSSAPTVVVPTVSFQVPPRPSSTSTPALATVVLPMGRLSDPANTFYQLLDRPAGATGWTLATPPGVADNGGLVVGPSAAGALTAGFLPATDLTFSVLASRAAGSTTWVPTEVSGTLAAVPDGLATGPSGQTAAVLADTRSTVEAAAPEATTWHRLVDAAELDTGSAATGGSAGAATCRVTRVSAVAVSSSGLPYVGARCAGTGVGIFVPTDAAAASSPGLPAPTGGWSRIGTASGGTGVTGVTATSVLRLQPEGTGVAGLVQATGSGRASVVGVWGTAGGLVTSPALAVPGGWSVAATATGGAGGAATQGLAVLLHSATSSRLLTLTGPGQPWTSAATPPSGTTAVALVGTELDAFVPAGSNLHVWVATGTGPWRSTADLTVPIQYGSSS